MGQLVVSIHVHTAAPQDLGWNWKKKGEYQWEHTLFKGISAILLTLQS